MSATSFSCIFESPSAHCSHSLLQLNADCVAWMGLIPRLFLPIDSQAGGLQAGFEVKKEKKTALREDSWMMTFRSFYDGGEKSIIFQGNGAYFFCKMNAFLSKCCALDITWSMSGGVFLWRAVTVVSNWFAISKFSPAKSSDPDGDE